MVKQGLIIGAATALVLLVAIIDNIRSHVTYEERQSIDVGIKIVFPVNGQRVPIGQLVLFGTLLDNGAISNIAFTRPVTVEA